MTQYQYSGENSAAIKADIERTRSNMSHKIDAIQERFQPEHLKQQTQDVVRSAMQDGGEAVVEYLRDHASDFSGSLIDTLKRNPVPSALIGLGLGLVLYDSFNQQHKTNGHGHSRYSERYDSGYGDRRYMSAHSADRDAGYQYTDRRSYATSGLQAEREQGSGFGEQIRDRVQDVRDGLSDTTDRVEDQLHEVGGQLGEFGEEAKHRAHQVGRQAYHAVEANPLGVGLAALAVGAALGLALPATRRENRMVGEWRDQVVDRAKHKASDVAQRVQDVVQEAKPELNEIANRVIDDVAQTGKSAVGEVKESVQRVTNSD